MKKEINAWAVVWTASSMPIYGTEKNPIVVAATDEVQKGKYIQIDFPLFRNKKIAEEFRNKNKDWKVVPCIVKILN